MPTIFSTACVFVDALGLNEKCGQFEECIAECSDNAFTCSYMGMKNLMLNFHRSHLNRRSAVALSCVRPCTFMCSPVQCHVFAHALSRVRPTLSCVRPCAITCSPAQSRVRPCTVTCSPVHCHVFAHALSRVRPRTITRSSAHCHVIALQCHVFARALSRVRPALSPVRPSTIDTCLVVCCIICTYNTFQPQGDIV